MTDTKLCRTCGQVKPISEFSKGNSYHQCKPCKNAYMRKWRKEHPEGLVESAREWREKNREAYRAYGRRYWAEHAEQKAVNRAMRRARKRNAPISTLTQERWAWVVEQYDGQCVYCGERPETVSMDHVIPLSKGGNHSLGNVVPACLPCNKRKQARTPEEAGMPIMIQRNLLEQLEQATLF